MRGNFENYLGQILTPLLNSRVACLNADSRQEGECFLFRDSEQRQFYLGTDIVKISGVGALPEFLERLSGSSCYSQIGRPQFLSRQKKELRKFAIIDCQQKKLSGWFFAAADKRDNWPLADRFYLPSTISVGLWLACALDKILKCGECININPKLTLRTDCFKDQQVLPVKYQNECFYLSQGAEKMETHKIIINVRLGSLELDLNDFLNLRPGDLLDFSMPENYEVLLQLGGSSWAEAKIHDLSGKPKLELLKLLNADHIITDSGA